MIWLSTQPFSYHADRRVFSAEASDLRVPAGRSLRSFLLVGSETGRSAEFRLDRVDRDRDGDVQAWHYRPVVPTNPFGDVTITIWND